MLHSTESSGGTPAGESKNICSSEKMTQAGDGNIWQIAPVRVYIDNKVYTNLKRQYCRKETTIFLQVSQSVPVTNTMMTCQELLALSGALSAALPTGQLALDSLFTSLSQSILSNQSRRWMAPTSSPTICFVDQPHLKVCVFVFL